MKIISFLGFEVLIIDRTEPDPIMEAWHNGYECGFGDGQYGTYDKRDEYPEPPAQPRS